MKDFVGPRQRARRIRLEISEQLNENGNEVTNDQEIERYDVQPLNPSGVDSLENLDAQIVDNEDEDAEHYADREVSDESLSCELDGSSSTDDDNIVSDLSHFEDEFDFGYEGFQNDASDFDGDSVDDDGQDKDFDWDYYEGNDHLREKERQELFKGRFSHWTVVTNVLRSSVDKLWSVLRTEQYFSFLPRFY